MRSYRKVAELAPQTHRANAQLDATIAELAVLTWRSTANFYEWAAYLQGDKSVAIAEVLHDEIHLTHTFGAYLTRPELGIGNPVWAWQRALAASVPEVCTDNYKMNYVSETSLRVSDFTKCNASPQVPSCVGDYIASKISGLEKQLAEL